MLTHQGAARSHRHGGLLRFPHVRNAVYCGLVATGGVSTKGGRGLGGAGRIVPGAGRTSIGGGNGATCWLTMGGGAEAALGDATGGSGWGTTTRGFNGIRRGSWPGTGISDSG